jgi:hypothetical protein
MQPSQASQASQARPWSETDFKARVASFSAMRWFAKPRSISAAECARFGWINDAAIANRLRCAAGCSATIDFPHQFEQQMRQVEAAALEFRTILASAHSEFCPWNANPSPLDFLGEAAFRSVEEGRMMPRGPPIRTDSAAVSSRPSFFSSGVLSEPSFTASEVMSFLEVSISAFDARLSSIDALLAVHNSAQPISLSGAFLREVVRRPLSMICSVCWLFHVSVSASMSVCHLFPVSVC